MKTRDARSRKKDKGGNGQNWFIKFNRINEVARDRRKNKQKTQRQVY